MKKVNILKAVGVTLGTLATLTIVATNAEAASVQMYRVYNPNSGEHFYTKSSEEKQDLVNVGWKDEGIGWTAPTSGDDVYRVYNPNSGDHHYTLNAGERDMLLSVGWKYEGIGWQSDTSKAVPLYRSYNPNAKVGSHNYTTSQGEHGSLINVGWKDEGIGWYGINSDNGNNNGGSTPTPEPEKPSQNGLLDQKYAQQTLVLLNEYRVSKGLQPLKLDAEFTKASEIRSKELVQSYGHTRPNGQNFDTAYTGPYWARGEVAGQKFDTDEFNIPSVALNSFKNSPAHEKILSRNDIEFIGISFYKQGDGMLYYAWITGMRL